jgi:hypothetical protein
LTDIPLLLLRCVLSRLLSLAALLAPVVRTRVRLVNLTAAAQEEQNFLIGLGHKTLKSERMRLDRNNNGVDRIARQLAGSQIGGLVRD